MVPAGLLIDTVGVRRIVGAGGALMGLGTIVMGAAPTQAFLFAGRLGVGLGATVTFIGALKIAANWFPPSHFATLSALTATVGVLGSLVGTFPFAWLTSVAGWRGGFWVMGLVTIAGSLACLWLVRDHPSRGRALEPPPPSLRDVLQGMVEVFRNRHTWPPFLSFFFLYSATGNLMLWIVPCLKDLYGLSTPAAALYATATSLALLFSAPLTGYLSDRVLRRRKLPYTVLTLCTFALWLVLAAAVGALPLWGIYALLFAMGLVGGSFVLTWPIGREVNPPALSGIAVAVVNLGGFLGAALTQGPIGAVLDARWAGTMAAGARVYPIEAYRAAFGVCALFALASALITFFLRETRGANIYRELAARRTGPRGGAAGPS
jgi:MFS family permease